jgi:uridine phosphorylase
VKRAWYLDVAPDQVAERCVMVGDPGRIDLFAARLRQAHIVNEKRGLRTVTGHFDGVPVTVTAFGMGAPIATIVLEELAALGTRIFLRAGTAMSLSQQLPLGSFVVGLASMRREGTSLTYAPACYPAVADFGLTLALSMELERSGVEHRVGVIASDDGFYNQLFPLSEDREAQVADRVAELQRLRVLAADMETSALLTVGAILGVRTASLCLISVDGLTRSKLDPLTLESGERRLVDVALRVVACADPEKDGKPQRSTFLP